MGDNYLENINVMVSWGFVALVTAIYIVSQNFLLGLIVVIFTIMRPIPQLHHESSFTIFWETAGPSLERNYMGLSQIVCKAANLTD
ncbi:MAG: hypothetical protein V8T37_00880 [Streptococcus sp.]